VPLLELALRRKLIDVEQHAVLEGQLEEIAKMLSDLFSGLENRKVTV
jgi:hypothetical protein